MTRLVGHAEVIEGLSERLDVPLGLSLLVLVTFLSLEATTMDGVGLLCGVSSAWGHSGFLRLV